MYTNTDTWNLFRHEKQDLFEVRASMKDQINYLQVVCAAWIYVSWQTGTRGLYLTSEQRFRGAREVKPKDRMDVLNLFVLLSDSQLSKHLLVFLVWIDGALYECLFHQLINEGASTRPECRHTLFPTSASASGIIKIPAYKDSIANISIKQVLQWMYCMACSWMMQSVLWC